MKYFDRTLFFIMFFAALLLMVILLVLSDQARAQSGITKQHALFKTKHAGTVSEMANRDFLVKNYDAYESAIRRLGMGAKQRREWVEWLGVAKNELNLSEVEFDIYPLVEVVSDDVINIGQETISLKLSLLHEGQLLELISYLRRQVRYPFEIISMEIKRDAAKLDNGLTKPKQRNLIVRCDIRWYSIDASGEKVEPG